MSAQLTPGQRVFAQRLASRTGLNSRVISAWMLAEESGGAAASRQRQGNHNWLNIGYFDSGPGGITKNGVFRDPRTAADATAKFLEGKWGGASSGIRGILSARDASPREQIARIAGSGWATDPRYGRNILSLWGGGAPAPGADSGSLRSSGVAAGKTVPVAHGGDREARRAALLTYLARGQGDPHAALLTLGKSLQEADATPAPRTTRQPRSRAASAGSSSAEFPEGKSPLKELFYDPQGGWKNGQSIGAIGGHSDHVHVAAGPKTVKAIGEHAQRMGLHVGENNQFGDPAEPGVHTPTSYHYRKVNGDEEAIDVSGSPAAMSAFAKWVRSVFKLH